MFEQFESITGIIVAVAPSLVAAVAAITSVLWALSKFMAAVSSMKRDLKPFKKAVEGEVASLSKRLAKLEEKESGIYQKGAHDEQGHKKK